MLDLRFLQIYLQILLERNYDAGFLAIINCVDAKVQFNGNNVSETIFIFQSSSPYNHVLDILKVILHRTT